MKNSIHFIFIFCFIFIASLTLVSCGSGGTNNAAPAPSGSVSTGAFSNASALNTLNAQPNADFSSTGKASVNFTATDTNGSPILAILTKPSLSVQAKIALLKLFIQEALADVAGLSCTVTLPLATSCNVAAVSSSPPAAGTAGTVAAAIDIDNTGSMIINDASQLRKTAAQSFIDVLASDATNHMISVFDFSTSTMGVSSPLTDSRLDFAWTQTTSANAANAKAAVIVENGGATNLFNSIYEICADMKSVPTGATAAHFANSITASGSIDSVGSKTLLILTDGEDNSSSKTVNDVVSCLQSGTGNDKIVAYTVGLNVPVGSQAEADLQAIANANNGIYATATDAAVLDPIFRAIAGAATTGFNTATIQLSPIPSSGSTVQGSLNAGAASGTFSFVLP